MEPKNFNEELKKAEKEARPGAAGADGGGMRLDDTQRVKVLSPGRLVVKRFVRNKLAIVGASILAFMFIFCFIGPLFYPYGQTLKFYKTDLLQNSNFASAKERTEYTAHLVGGEKVHYSVANMIDTYIKRDMIPNDLKFRFVTDANSGGVYCIKYEAENVYTLRDCEASPVGTLVTSVLVGEYNSITDELAYSGEADMGAAFIAAVRDAVQNRASEFTYEGKEYSIKSIGGKKYAVRYVADAAIKYTAEVIGADFEAAAIAAAGSGLLEYKGDYYSITASDEGAFAVDRIKVGGMRYICSPYTINLSDGVSMATNDFLREALIGLAADGQTFTWQSDRYEIREENGALNIYRAGSGGVYGLFTTFSVSRSNGSGALPIEFKDEVKAKIDEMIEANKIRDTMITKVEKQRSDGSIELDESGNIVYADTEVTITRKGEDYSITCDRIEYLIDRFGKPMSNVTEALHPLGTDNDGYDVFSRIMYGGQISLIVGFVVVIIETLLGIIMGGVSGYFGGWVDTLIMRLVDVFNCIPTLPILIIIGAFFDAEQMSPRLRLMWLMAVLGFLGWAGVARMVRGQILSLREQDFMVAAEVGGLRVSRRIFRHLIPNVMPQLIVTATAGLGSVILTESTLSFLGLGVKHPLATWGSMIHSVSDYSSMINYTYIWVPVGLLICLTVIAFNFVGDGLRDAFDPKMKR